MYVVLYYTCALYTFKNKVVFIGTFVVLTVIVCAGIYEWHVLWDITLGLVEIRIKRYSISSKDVTVSLVSALDNQHTQFIFQYIPPLWKIYIFFILPITFILLLFGIVLATIIEFWCYIYQLFPMLIRHLVTSQQLNKIYKLNGLFSHL